MSAARLAKLARDFCEAYDGGFLDLPLARAIFGEAIAPTVPQGADHEPLQKAKPPALFWSVRYKPGPPEALRMFQDEPAAQDWIVQGFKNESLTGSREDWEVFPIFRGSLEEVSPYRATQQGPEAIARAKEMTICEIINDPYFTTFFKANRIAECFGAVAMGANL